MECVKCHVREATKNCFQCHKAVCDTCSFTDENGVFCGRTCAAKYREFNDNYQRKERKAGVGALGRLIGLVIIAVVILGALYVLGVFNREDVQKTFEKGKKAAAGVAEKGREAIDKARK